MENIVRPTHKVSWGSYGARRHARELTSQGYVCGRYRAKAIMAMARVEAKQKRRLKATTDSNHHERVSPKVLQRNFSTLRPNQVWVSDITYIRTWSGWLSLAVVVDLFNREAVSWAMSAKIDRHLVINSTRMAIWRRKPSSGLIFHSGCGSQYCSKDFQRYIAGHGIKGNMSHKGDCRDAALPA